MKALPFNIPATNDKTVIIKEETLPFFYPHLHRHKEIQITFVQKGEGTLTIGNQRHRFRENEIYLIGADVPHVFKSSPDYFNVENEQQVQALNIYFNPKGHLSTLFSLPELKDVSSFFTGYYGGFRIPLSSFADISGQILNIKYTDHLEQLLQFFGLLKSIKTLKNLSPLSSEEFIKPEADHDDLRISKICAFIMGNYHRNMTLDSVAECANMTAPSFCRYFKKHTRLTFIAFLNEVRVNEACKKLASGKYDTVAKIASDCGFANITNFNRVFKFVTGHSPSSYIHAISN